MMSARKDLLSGTPDQVAARLEELSRKMAEHEYLAGTGLRMLAVELAKRPGLQVTVVTYYDRSRDLEDSQELLVAFAGDPHCEPVTIDRDHVGEHCQITWDRWLHIRNDDEIETAADTVASMLSTVRPHGRESPRPVRDWIRHGPGLR